MPFKRAGSDYWWIRVGGLRQSSGTTDYEEAKALEAKLKHDRWLAQYMGVKPKRSWQEAVVKRVQEDSPRMASWSDEQQRLRWWDEHLRGVKDLNEITLKWDMVDFEKRAVQIAGRLTKTGKAIYVPLNKVAMAILTRRWEASDRHPVWVFHYRGEKIAQVLTKSWRAAREAVGLATTSFHTMRHCGQSWLAQQGVNAEWRARLGGWSVRGMGAMDDYSHLYIEPLRPYAELLGEQWLAAEAVRNAEKAAEGAALAVCSFDTLSVQTSGAAKHTAETPAANCLK